MMASILSQFAEGASFVWQFRDGAVRQPHYLLSEIAELDERLDAQVDGLRMSGDPGWELCAQVLEEGGPGEAFAAGVLAFEGGLQERIESVLKAAVPKPTLLRGLASALSWMPYAQAEPHLQMLLEDPVPALQRAGLAAACNHRRDPGGPLSNALNAADESLRARALRGVGELGLLPLQASLRRNLSDKDAAVQFWAAWSLALLTKAGEALRVLLAIGQKPGPFTSRALQLLMMALDPLQAQMVQRNLTFEPELARAAVIATGALGLPDNAPWLIEQMAQPALARVAGEAFSMITGANIANDQLEGEKPEGFEAGPTENPEDENVAMDEDDDLPWPDPVKIQKWWDKRQKQFARGRRHLLGKPITPESLQEALRTGYQRQRAAAALEIALRNPGQPLFNVRAPGWRQQQIMAGS